MDVAADPAIAIPSRHEGIGHRWRFHSWFDGNKDDAERFISISSSEIARYQRLMYANGVKGSHRRLLIVLQGMDASGKGGIVRHVFSQATRWHALSRFRRAKGEELDHDYLWRIKRELPNNGWISIFDRSHYEDIVMPRIYKTQPEEVWQARYDEINRFESQLTADGCAIIKIFLVVSKDEQKRHFLSRLDDPTKCWKFDPSDLEARARVGRYMAAWQDVFLRTSTEQAPWYLVPADNRWYSRAVVSELLRNTLKNMNMICRRSKSTPTRCAVSWTRCSRRRQPRRWIVWCPGRRFR